MAAPRRRIIGAAIVTLLGFLANAGFFLLSYNRLATPFLTEEQRAENAGIILTQIAGGYALIAVLIGLVAYAFLRLGTSHR